MSHGIELRFGAKTILPCFEGSGSPVPTSKIISTFFVPHRTVGTNSMADILQQKLVSDRVRVKIECDESYKGRSSNSVIGLFQPPRLPPAQSVGSVTKR